MATTVANAQAESSAEAKTDIWQQILEISSKKDVVPPKNLLVLGDVGCGSSALLAHIQGIEDTQSHKASALKYSYLDVYAGDEDDEPISRINVWQLEGHTDQKDLLHFGLHSDNLEQSAVLICLDFTRPWKLVSSLQKWLEVVTKFTYSLNIDPKRMSDAQQHLIRRFSEYQEPTDDGKRHKRAPKNEQTPVPTLPEGVFESNCGIPIVVCCTNTDTCEILERDFGYKDGHFEYIHQHLRRICLKYGASLIYTSVKNDRNCELLFEYLQHILYDMDLSSRPQLLERESVFVPAGWDTAAKIQADFDNQRLTRDAEEPFSKVIAVPPALQLAKQTDKLIVASAEEDHVFLQRLHQQIQSDPALASSGASADSQQMFLDAMKRIGVVGSSTPSPNVSSPSLVTTPAPAGVLPAVPTQASSPALPTISAATTTASTVPRPTSPAVPSASSATDLLASLSSTIAAAGSPARVGRQASGSVSTNAEHQALHSFFNSLLGGSGSATGSREAAAKVLNNNQK